jgi:TldD protein
VAASGAAAQAKALAPRRLPSRYAVQVPWSEVGVDQQLPLIQRANRVARARDRRIIKVTVFLATETSRVLVANSDGLLVEDDQPMGLLMVSCVGEHQGKTESAGDSLSAREGTAFFSDAAIDKLAQRATDHTTILFQAGPPPVGELPVVLAPGIPGILLHEAIGHGMEADFNRKGISIYAGRIGQRIAPKDVTIIDGGDGRMRGSLNVDDEGTGTEQTVLVDRGILRTYMHDRLSSQHYAAAATGSGRRESFRFPPVPRMRNTFMLNGPHAPEEIIRSVERGLFAEVFYNGQVNIGAGDFTFYLKHGRLIENGKLTRPVKDANLIGSGPKVLEQVAMVGNDLQMFSGGGYCGKDGQRVPVGFGLPTLKVGGISIGGRAS